MHRQLIIEQDEKAKSVINIPQHQIPVGSCQTCSTHGGFCWDIFLYTVFGSGILSGNNPML